MQDLPVQPRYKFKTSNTHIPKEGQHLIVSSIIWDEKAQVGIVQDSSNPYQASPSTRNDGDVFPRILTVFSFSVMGIVKVCYGYSERFDAGRRAILS